MMVVGILHYSRETGSKCIFRKVGCLNVLLSLLCLPWMHAVLPHSPLHVSSIIELNWTSIGNCVMVFVFFFFLLWFYDLFCQVRALADIDEHVEEGHVYDIIVKVAFNTWSCHMWSIQLLQSCHNLLDNPSEGLKNPVKPKKAQQRLYWRQKTSFYDAKPQDIWYCMPQNLISTFQVLTFKTWSL